MELCYLIYIYIYKQNEQLAIANKVVRVNVKALKVDDTVYQLTPGLIALISQKHPRCMQFNRNDYSLYKSLLRKNKLIT